MNKYLFFLFALFSNCTVTKIKSNEISIEKPQTFTFDTARYNRQKNHIDVAVYFADDGSAIEAMKIADGYSERKIITGTPYSIVSYYYPNLKLRKVINYFYETPSGISIEYDDTGKVLSQKNYNEEYKFGIKDLVKKILVDFNIDLMKKIEGTTVHRNFNSSSKQSEYVILYPKGIGKYQKLILNCKNGDIITNTEINSVD